MVENYWFKMVMIGNLKASRDRVIRVQMIWFETKKAK